MCLLRIFLSAECEKGWVDSMQRDPEHVDPGPATDTLHSIH